MRSPGERSALLDAHAPHRVVQAALDDYARTCEAVTGIAPDPGFDGADEDRYLDSGIAIHPRAAAHCVADYRRTTVYLRAVHDALRQLLERHPDTRVRILYAGCGPWATLLFPVLGAFPPERLGIQLLDIHPEALEGVRRLIDHFGYGDHAIELVAGDASTHRCEPAPHLVVTETMRKALEEEPQFAVTAGLAPQLAPGGILIPERIDVDLCLTSSAGSVPLARVLTLSADHCTAPDPVHLDIPADADPAIRHAELVTSIRVFGTHRLESGEAHITLPRPCHELSPLPAGATVCVEFRPGSCPMFEFTIA